MFEVCRGNNIWVCYWIYYYTKLTSHVLGEYMFAINDIDILTIRYLVYSIYIPYDSTTHRNLVSMLI